MSHCTWNRVSWQINSIRNSLGQQQGLPFVDLLTPDMLREVAGQTAESSEPIYTPLVTLWMFLGQVVDPDHSCRQAVARLLVWLTLQGQPPCCAETGAYCKARVRLSEEHLHGLVRATGAELHDKAQAEWLWKGRRVKIADGTTVIMPDTEANQAEYPQPDGQKPGLGFPMIRLVVLFCLATGAVLDAAVAAYSGKGTGELSLLRLIWDELQKGEVLLADRLYCSWFEMALLKQRGVDVVLHRHQSRRTDFRKGHSLGQRDHLVRWPKPARPDWMDQETYASLPAELELRELEVVIDRKGFRPVKLILVTTLLDAEEYRPKDLAEVYWQRWHAELDLRSVKETMQMGELRCKTPAMVRKEIWVAFSRLQFDPRHDGTSVCGTCTNALSNQLQRSDANAQCVSARPADFAGCCRNLPAALKSDRHAPRRRPSRPRRASRKEAPQEKLRSTHTPSFASQKTFDENNLKPGKCHWGGALGCRISPLRD